jgi:hypothetical protein
MPAKSPEALERKREANRLREKMRRERIAQLATSDPDFAMKQEIKKLERNKRRAEQKRAARIKAKQEAGGPDIPDWKKRKPGRLVALNGWSGWGW